MPPSRRTDKVQVGHVGGRDEQEEPDGAGWERLPAPRLWVGVSAGTIDSLVTNYTASRNRRSQPLS